VSSAFRVHLAELSHVVEELDRFQTHLAAALEEVDAKVTELHGTWTGDAAEAHQAAHDQWKQGADDMGAGLETMRENASTAHANYTSAVTANAAMWKEVQ
jgi:WXG100 family type VII secretion target